MMTSLRSPTRTRRTATAGLLLVCGAALPALAAAATDDDQERQALAALTRQLDMADRIAARAAAVAVAPTNATRYHFDYPRLHDDLARIRAGVQDYLVPRRAQPRDPLPLSGAYARDAADGVAR